MEEQKKKGAGLRWRNVWKIYKRDIYQMLHNPVALLIIGGLLILPSLYAWVNIVACWDPYGNTNGIQVAVVNNDNGVTLQGKEICAGDEIIKQLRENDAIGWCFVEEEDANYGLTHDKYYAMLEIPDNFTSQLLLVLEEDYTRPQIIYRVNEKYNAIAPKITDTGAKTVTNQVTRAILEVVDQVVFSLGDHAGHQLEQKEDRIQRIRDAVLYVNDHTGELTDTLNQAQQGLATVEEVLEHAERTLPLIADSTQEMAHFSLLSQGLLQQAQQWQNDGAEKIGAQFTAWQRLLEETSGLLAQVDVTLADAQDWTQQLEPVLEKVHRMQTLLEEMTSWLAQQDLQNPDYDKWVGLLQQAQTATNKLVLLTEQLQQHPDTVQQALLLNYDITAMLLEHQQNQVEHLIQAVTLLEQKAQSPEAQQRLQQQRTELEAAQAQLQEGASQVAQQREALATMSPEEVDQKLQQLADQILSVQQKLGSAQQVLQRLQASGLGVEDVLQGLELANVQLSRGLHLAEQMLHTADKAFVLAEDILAQAEDTIGKLQQLMTDITDQYQNRWAGELEQLFGHLYATLENLDLALTEVNQALPKVAGLLEYGTGLQQDGVQAVQKLQDTMPQLEERLQKLSQVLSQLSDENLNTLIALLENDSEAAADYFAGPVELKEERLYHLENYGSAMAPFYTVLAMWVGCLLLSTLLTTEARPLAPGVTNTLLEEYFGKLLTFLTLALGQSLIVVLGDKFILGVTVADLGVMVGFGLLTSLTFILIVYSLVSVLGSVGKAACVILLVLQIAGAGGTFPVEVMPPFYQMIQPFLPFTYAIGAMREAVSGPVLENLLYDGWHLLLFAALGLLVGITLKKPLHPLLEWFNETFKKSGLGE